MFTGEAGLLPEKGLLFWLLRKLQLPELSIFEGNFYSHLKSCRYLILNSSQNPENTWEFQVWLLWALPVLFPPALCLFHRRLQRGGSPRVKGRRRLERVFSRYFPRSLLCAVSFPYKGLDLGRKFILADFGLEIRGVNIKLFDEVNPVYKHICFSPRSIGV